MSRQCYTRMVRKTQHHSVSRLPQTDNEDWVTVAPLWSPGKPGGSPALWSWVAVVLGWLSTASSDVSGYRWVMSERGLSAGLAWVSDAQAPRGDLSFGGECPSVPEPLSSALGGEGSGGGSGGNGLGEMGQVHSCLLWSLGQHFRFWTFIGAHLAHEHSLEPTLESGCGLCVLERWCGVWGAFILLSWRFSLGPFSILLTSEDTLWHLLFSKRHPN